MNGMFSLVTMGMTFSGSHIWQHARNILWWINMSKLWNPTQQYLISVLANDTDEILCDAQLPYCIFTARVPVRSCVCVLLLPINSPRLGCWAGLRLSLTLLQSMKELVALLKCYCRGYFCFCGCFWVKNVKAESAALVRWASLVTSYVLWKSEMEKSRQSSFVSAPLATRLPGVWGRVFVCVCSYRVLSWCR